MEQRVKQRLIGAVILVSLGVVFIPMLLKGPVKGDHIRIPVEIPPRSQVAPVSDIPKPDPLADPVPDQQRAVNNPPPINVPSVPVDEPRAATSNLRPTVPVTGFGGAVASKEASASAWAVQVGSFQKRDNAQALRQELQQGGFSTYVEQARYEHKPLFRVRVGPVAGRSKAEQLAARLHKERGIKGLVVKK